VKAHPVFGVPGQDLDVDVVRLSPQSQAMVEVIAVFDAARGHTLTPEAALALSCRACLPTRVTSCW